MVGENRSQWFRFKNKDETRNFLEEMKGNELMTRKHKKVCTTLNYIEHFLVLALTITGCISNSAFASLLGILTEITKILCHGHVLLVIFIARKYKLKYKKQIKKSLEMKK